MWCSPDASTHADMRLNLQYVLSSPHADVCWLHSLQQKYALCQYTMTLDHNISQVLHQETSKSQNDHNEQDEHFGEEIGHLKASSSTCRAWQKDVCKQCGTGEAASSKPASKTMKACCRCSLLWCCKKAAPNMDSTAAGNRMSLMHCIKSACRNRADGVKQPALLCHSRCGQIVLHLDYTANALHDITIHIHMWRPVDVFIPHVTRRARCNHNFTSISCKWRAVAVVAEMFSKKRDLPYPTCSALF